MIFNHYNSNEAIESRNPMELIRAIYRTKSTAAAELVALSDTFDDVIGITTLLESLSFQPVPKVLCENTTAVYLAKLANELPTT